MDVEQIAVRYGGLPAAVVAKGKEYLRLTLAKKSASLDQFAGSAACLLVAGQALSVSVDKKKLAKCAGSSVRVVNATMPKVVNAVSAQKVVRTSPAALCIKFGCEALTEIVGRVLDEYRAYLGQVAASNKRRKARHPLGPVMSSMSDREPVFVAACLYAVSKKAKMNVNQGRLVEAVCGNNKSFEAIVSSIETQCQLSLNGAVGDRKKRRMTASELAARRLTEQQRHEQEEDEERVKRRKQNTHGETTPMTKSQQRVLQQLRATATTAPRSPRPNAAVVATPEEYAQWRAMALAFMRTKSK